MPTNWRLHFENEPKKKDHTGNITSEWRTWNFKSRTYEGWMSMNVVPSESIMTKGAKGKSFRRRVPVFPLREGWFIDGHGDGEDDGTGRRRRNPKFQENLDTRMSQSHPGQGPRAPSWCGPSKRPSGMTMDAWNKMMHNPTNHNEECVLRRR